MRVAHDIPQFMRPVIVNRISLPVLDEPILCFSSVPSLNLNQHINVVYKYLFLRRI